MDVVNGQGILGFDGEAVIRVLLVAHYCNTAKPSCRLQYQGYERHQLKNITAKHRSSSRSIGWLGGEKYYWPQRAKHVEALILLFGWAQHDEAHI